MRKTNFDKVAGVYDLLTYVVFWGRIQKAQGCFLNEIEENQRILIAGGGTGNIIKQLSKLDIALHVTYIEPSGKMITKAKKRVRGKLEVQFVQNFLENVRLARENYDAIVTPFFLDVFDAAQLDLIINQLIVAKTKKGIWLLSDFHHSMYRSTWKRRLLSTMLLFFRYTALLPATKLLNFDEIFHQKGLSKRKERFFACKTIYSSLWI